ncbi:putative Cyclin delta-3 [Melia azedarach]|uniref:Cyclin delta-3 n=1 Tax=Melia azedarach TaxID=155640 RepID=A0ACC1XX31_MELAZ|nr:putative Cyclin delta-3 [Melia azedarach]
MKIGGGLVYGLPRATALNTLFFRRGIAISSLSVCSSRSPFPEHISFIKNVATTEPPQHLSYLLRLLKARGGSIISPGAKQGLIPLAIPLAKSSSGAVTALLRWPTAPSGLEMPVVEVQKHGVWLLARNVEQFINRILVEEDAKTSLGIDKVFLAATEDGEKFYQKGDFAKSQISDTDVYLLRKVGLFPDVIERKVMHHFAKEDHVSALVTAEFYTKKEHFPGFARPFVFNAEVLLKVGRNLEAKDAARGALKSPWWTLGCKYQEVAQIAQWEDEQIEYIKGKVTEEGKQEDLNKGKPRAQIALDEAAFLLDLASVEGTWDDSVQRVAECYKEAGLHNIAAFMLYRD